MKKRNSTLIVLCSLAVLASCSKGSSSSSQKAGNNLVTNETNSVNTKIGDDKVQMRVLSRNILQNSNVVSTSTVVAREALGSLPQGDASAQSIHNGANIVKSENSLLLGMPVGLVGEQNVFGGVFTKVSDTESETLGGLKLTDLPPLTVKTYITGMEEGKPSLTLAGCVSDCDEDSRQGPVVSFSIVGYDDEYKLIILDLAPIGKELDLTTMMDPDGGYTKLKAISSETTAFDYSASTLVFDVKTVMIPVTAQPTDPDVKKTEISVRWYLKLTSAFNPAFTSRPATEGVGFFRTERSKNSRITRFSTTGFGQSVKYFIKNVPEKHRPAFAKAFDSWNVEFKKIIGKDLLSYEFIEKTDPRHESLIPGDIRYNILEWDLVNKAGYGGLGPSIANQFTGETLSANVLIQGPTIIELYTKWFNLSEEVHLLRDAGQNLLADTKIKAFHADVALEMEKRDAKFQVKLGKDLVMNVRAQNEQLEDPIKKNHFEVVPKGITFDDYMEGYFLEMVAHELGHNLGLRHNFKGNLGAVENSGEGSVSRSIMEYMGRPYRHLNRVGLYDKMALNYGYKGIKPTHLDWFCTDEDQGSNAITLATKSPECTKSDATNDPYSFWEKRIDRTIELLVAPDSPEAPVWNLADLTTQVDEFTTGLAAYALSAEKTFTTWTNFTGKLDRPESAAGMKEYVLASFRKKLCDESLAPAILAKESVAAQELARKNLDELRKAVTTKTEGWALFKADELKCE